ncbi:hypothetical protein [Ruegeria sp. HKCCA4008]|uniref:hypothetical protein n=1 Tax=Ruegeria sp. HKCCA4008 TaxID=2682999 RepID=UPI0014893550|nr:hypothetical protein [Ruegeria sp. HKCCA4008]
MFLSPRVFDRSLRVPTALNVKQIEFQLQAFAGINPPEDENVKTRYGGSTVEQGVASGYATHTRRQQAFT